MIDDKTFNSVSQLSHFGGSCAVIFGSIVLFGSGAMWWSLLFIAVITGWKEFWYDYHYETPEIRGSSLEDFIYYMVGGFSAVISVLIKNYFIK